MKKLLLVLPIIAYFLFGTESVAQQSIWPGSQCVRWTASDVVPTLNGSAIYNNSATQAMRVDCPVERYDFSSFLHWPAVESAWVSVIDTNYSVDARCWQGYLSVASSGVWTFGTTSSAYSAGSSFGSQTLYLGAMSIPNDQAHVFVGCTIPQTYAGNASYLVNYYVNQ
jgi:hypothetical protein